MRTSPALLLYRLAWEPALWTARLFPWPARWRVQERLGYGIPHVTPSPAGPALWLHAASLGECKGMWAVARALAASSASAFVLTANTDAGRDFLAAQVSARGGESGGARWTVALAPFDHPRAVRAFRRAHGIGALVLFEMELWPHFVRETRRAGRSVYWVSARFTARAARRYGGFPGALRAVLGAIAWTQAHSDAEADLLRARGAPCVETGADLRGLHYLEGASRSRGSAVAWEERAGAALVSLHADELPVLLPVLRRARADLPLFVFPRKPGELPAFRAALEPLGFGLRSRDPGAARQLVDGFGQVPEILARCRAAVVGGSFAPHGGHNLWEPLVAGVATAIGPRHESQEYLAARMRAAGLLEIASAPDLDALHALPERGEAAAAFVRLEAERLRESLQSVTRVIGSREFSASPESVGLKAAGTVD